jgi:hypothetical protein
MVVKPGQLVERKLQKDRRAVEDLEKKIDEFLETHFDGTGEVIYDLPEDVSREAINQLVVMYGKNWEVYHFTGSQRDACNRLIFNYGGRT